MDLKNHLPKIEEKIKYTFQDKDLLVLAFIHRSFANEDPEFEGKHNERLEFLGDAILGVMISDFLYRNFPDQPEGELSFLRSRLVDATSCMRFLEELEIGDYMVMGKGELMNQGKGRQSIHSDLFEALIGAIYLDGGMKSAEVFFFGFFEKDIHEIVKEPFENWKVILQNYSQKRYQKPPVYRVMKEEGPDHGKTFYVTVSLANKEVGEGCGLSKKEAEQQAAQNAIGSLGICQK